MQRILRVGDDQGMCRGSLENSECELPWQLKCEGTARIPPWACVCPVHVPTVPWHSIIQPPTAEGPRLVWGAPAGSQRGFHKSIQEQREWNWISRGRSVSLALVYVKVVTLGSLESCLQCFYVDTEFTRHWGWPCQENSLQMKYNTSKIFWGDVGDGDFEMYFQDLMNPSNVESNTYLEGEWFEPTHSRDANPCQRRQEVSVLENSVGLHRSWVLTLQLTEEEYLRWLCSIPVRAQGNVRCESGKSVAHVFPGSPAITQNGSLGGFFWEWDWLQRN